MNQFARFIFVGVLNTSLGYAIIFASMYLLHLSAVVSNVIGYLLGLTISYSLNRKFTFRSTAQSGPEVVKFLFVFITSYLLNLAVLVLLIRNTQIHEGISQVIAGVACIAASYSLNKYYVFRVPSD